MASVHDLSIYTMDPWEVQIHVVLRVSDASLGHSQILLREEYSPGRRLRFPPALTCRPYC
jgi:hypothetical protein